MAPVLQQAAFEAFVMDLKTATVPEAAEPSNCNGTPACENRELVPALHAHEDH
jgi:hypothetical protein